MAEKQRILIQLDSDAQASVFDSVTAIDAGVEHLLRHGAVRPEAIRELVHGAIFTRGPDSLRNTAIFIGGSDVELGQSMLKAVCDAFFGPMRVSVMMDANGANTTAAATVLAAARHVRLEEVRALVLAATGPVGRRVAELLARHGTTVRVASRQVERADRVRQAIEADVPDARLSAVATGTDQQTRAACEGVQVIVAAGAPGVQLLSESNCRGCRDLKVALDLNAVAPSGIGGIEPADNGVQRGGVACYGAIGVGATKMKIHKAAVRRLFERNDQVLDCTEIFEIGRDLAD